MCHICTCFGVYSHSKMLRRIITLVIIFSVEKKRSRCTTVLSNIRFKV